jgi:hypothetical protein
LQKEAVPDSEGFIIIIRIPKGPDLLSAHLANNVRLPIIMNDHRVGITADRVYEDVPPTIEAGSEEVPIFLENLTHALASFAPFAPLALRFYHA